MLTPDNEITTLRDSEMFAPTLTKFILSSRAKPAMYWGDSSLKTVANNIAGFDMAIWSLAREHKREVFPKLAFTSYVAARLKRTVNGHAWDTLLLETYRDDGTAFKEFIDLYEEFVSSYRALAQTKRFRLLSYPRLRGYFVVALPPFEWGEFQHYATLSKAKAAYSKLLLKPPTRRVSRS